MVKSGKFLAKIGFVTKELVKIPNKKPMAKTSHPSIVMLTYIYFVA